MKLVTWRLGELVNSAVQTIALAILVTVIAPAPAAAQTRRASSSDEPTVSFRPFFLLNGEAFAAQKTFEAVFGRQSLRPFLGGGLQIGFRERIFVELNATRFTESGQRVFITSDGTIFQLGIPLDVKITTFEVAGGYRHPIVSWLWVYGGAGMTRYRYIETSTFAEAGENTDTTVAGLAVLGGIEYRVHSWVRVAGEVAHTRVKGVLGNGGISKDFGEDDLGGTAIRLKVLVGR
jgi:hypothetical protein